VRKQDSYLTVHYNAIQSKKTHNPAISTYDCLKKMPANLGFKTYPIL